MKNMDAESNIESCSNTRQALWVAIGSLASICLSFVSAAILSRFLTKSDYGTYRQVIYVYSTLLAVFSVGLPRAISYFLPRVSLDEGRDLVNKITNVFYVMGGLFSLFLYSCAPLIARMLNNDELVTALRIFSPVPILMLPTLGIDSIYSTYRQTYISAIFAVISRASMLVCIVTPVVLFKGDSSVALWGFVASSFIVYLVSLYLKRRPFRGYTYVKCKFTTRYIVKYSLPLMYAGFFSIAISATDQFFVSRYFGAKVFAEYFNGSMEIPLVGMIIGACSVVLAPLFSKYVDRSDDPHLEIIPLWNRVFWKTAMITYPIVAFFWFYADEIMNIIYGAQYSDSAIYFKISIIANIFTLIVYGPLLLSLGKTMFFAKVHLYGFVVLVGLEYLSLITFDSPYVITAVSVLCKIGRIIAMIIFISRLFKVSFWEMFPVKYIFKILVPSAVILFLITNFVDIQGDISRLVIGGSIYGVLYLIWAYFAKLDYLSLAKSFIR